MKLKRAKNIDPDTSDLAFCWERYLQVGFSKWGNFFWLLQTSLQINTITRTRSFTQYSYMSWLQRSILFQTLMRYILILCLKYRRIVLLVVFNSLWMNVFQPLLQKVSIFRTTANQMKHLIIELPLQICNIYQHHPSLNTLKCFCETLQIKAG